MKKKSAILAGLLNVLIPGLGALYAGNWKRAIANFFLGLVLIVSLIFFNGFLIRSEPPWPAFICPSLSVLLYIVTAFMEGSYAAWRRNHGMRDTIL